MAKTISHGWTTSEPDAGKDVDVDNLNDHQESFSGLTAGHVLRASAATAADFAAIQDGDLPATIARDSEVTSAVAAEATARDTAIGVAVAALSGTYQPLDSDLTAIAALTTTSFGRAFLALADAAAGRTALGLGTASTHATGDYDAAGAAAAAQAASQPLDADLTSIAALSTTAFGRGLLALADAAALRTSAGTVIGTDVEAHDTDLTTIAGLTPTNDDVIQRKAGAWTNRTIAQLSTDLGIAAGYQPLDSDLTAIAALTTTSFGRGFLALADAAAGRSTLGLGTAAVAATGDFDAAGAAAAAQAASQPLDSDLTAFAALAIAADKLPYGTGSHTLGLADFTAAGRALVDDADASAQRTTLGLGTAATHATTDYDASGAAAAAQAASQPVDATLTALAGLATGANKLPYSTGTDTFAQTDLTAAGRALIDDADAAAQRTTLGLVIGTDVQAQDAELAALAGLTSAANKLPYFTGSGTAAVADLTAAARTVLDDTTVAAMLTTLGAEATANRNVANGYAPLDSGILVPFANLPTGTGASQVAIGNHTHAGTGVAVSPELVKKYTPNASNTASSALTLTAHAAGHRMIVVIASYARDVNTPTCTNVTFTEVLGVAFSTTIFLSIYVGVIAGGSSGTTLTITAGSSNWIVTDVYVVSDALTPTAGTSATLTNTDASSQASVAVGPIAPAIGSFYIIGAAQNDGTIGFSAMTMNAGDAIGVKITPGGNSGLASMIGRTTAANVYGYTTGGSSGGDFAAGIVIVS